MQPLSFLSLLRFHPADFARFCIKSKRGEKKKSQLKWKKYYQSRADVLVRI